MVDRSCWDQSFVDAVSPSPPGSGSGGFVDVFDDDHHHDRRHRHDDDDAPWGSTGVIRKSTSCTDGRSWSPAAAASVNGCCNPTILCSSPSSCGADSGRASTSDDRLYQNGVGGGAAAAGFLAVHDAHWSSSSSSSAELCPAAADLIVLDSGAFSESSSGGSAATAAATPASEPLTGCAARSLADSPARSTTRSSAAAASEPLTGCPARSTADFTARSTTRSLTTAAPEPLTGCAARSTADCRSRSSAAAAATSDSWWRTTTDAGAAYSRVASFLPAWDAERLESAYRALAACGFYYGRMSMDAATERLAGRAVGAFLLRDSADRRYLFSLSVQTCRGTTSIRLSYRSGLFRLDCSADQEHLMPTFDCPLRLLTHYVRLCSTGAGGGPRPASEPRRPGDVRRHRHGYVLLESSGRRDTPVLLVRPYRERPSSLAHLCRRTVHRALADGGRADHDDSAAAAAVDRLQLQPSLKTYLKLYPYDL